MCHYRFHKGYFIHIPNRKQIIQGLLRDNIFCYTAWQSPTTHQIWNNHSGLRHKYSLHMKNLKDFIDSSTPKRWRHTTHCPHDCIWRSGMYTGVAFSTQKPSGTSAVSTIWIKYLLIKFCGVWGAQKLAETAVMYFEYTMSVPYLHWRSVTSSVNSRYRYEKIELRLFWH